MAEELLDQVIQLLEEPLAGVELRRAWGPGWASRLLEGPVASGEVLSHHREGDRQETVLRFSLFAPEAQERREADAALEAAVVQLCPGCVEIDREEEREDTSIPTSQCSPILKISRFIISAQTALKKSWQKNTAFPFMKRKR